MAMILAWAVVLGLLASLARHRSQVLSCIASIPLRSAWLAPLALALQIPLLRASFGSVEQVRGQQVLFLLSHLLLLVFAWRNRRLAGVRILAVGVACNLLVILANGGWMPITPATLQHLHPGTAPDLVPLGYHYGYSKDVVLLREETVLWILSDVLVIPPPFPWPVAFSPGDLLIAAGIVVLLQGAVSRQVQGTLGLIVEDRGARAPTAGMATMATTTQKGVEQ